MTNFVQQYRSTDLNAPVLAGTAGSLIAMLDAILKDGYSTASVTGITRSGTTATATLASANTTLVSGDYLQFAGANETDYNVVGPITVNSSTSVSYQVANSPTTPATGTITYRKAPLGWTKPFSGTNLAAYLPQSVSGYPQFYLRIEEAGNSAGGQKECVATGAESMSDINTLTNQFPTSAQIAVSGTASKAGVCWRKSATADSTARAWTLFGNGHYFHLQINSEASNTSGRALLGFGGFPSFKSADAYNCLITGGAAFNTVTQTNGNSGIGQQPLLNASMGAGCYIARSNSQAGGSVPAMVYNYGAQTNDCLGAAISNGITYPGPSDGALWVISPILFDAVQSPRGRVPGLFTHMHSSRPINEYDKATNVNGLSGVTLTGITVATSTSQGLALIDTFGPW